MTLASIPLFDGICVAVSLVVIVSTCATAHYLYGIRETLREMAKVQKALASRLGAKV